MFLGAKIRFFSDIARVLGENHCLSACWADLPWGQVPNIKLAKPITNTMLKHRGY